MTSVAHSVASILRTGAVLLILTGSAVHAAAQSQLNTTGTSNCVAADFDTNLEFSNTADHYFVITVSRRNLADHPCIFDGFVYPPIVLPDHVNTEAPFTLLPERRIPGLTLEPGLTIWQTIRWRTKAANDSIPCLQNKWMSDPVRVTAPSLLPQICSDIEVSRFTQDHPIILPNATNSPGQHVEPSLILSSSKNAYDLGERFNVRVSLSQPQKAEVEDDVCPTLYVRQRSPNGATIIYEQQPLAFKGCKQNVLGDVLGYEAGDWQSGFDMDSGATYRWGGIGDHEMTVLQLASSVDAPSLRFVTSNMLRVKVIDPTTLPRGWGEHVKGIAADVSLDKSTYQVGEDVPLHLAIKDFHAPAQLYSWDAIWDPGMVIGIEVQDGMGRVISEKERFEPFIGHMGHGFGPRPFPRGKVVALERTLRSEGWLPNRPGLYMIKLTWQPCFSPSHRETSPEIPSDLQSYASAIATARIKIVSGP